MSESVLPLGIEELGELVISGDMTSHQIDEFLENHSHYVFECDEICNEIFDSFDDYPLRLLIEHNFKKMTPEQCRRVHEELEDHISPQDQGTRANIASARLKLSVGRGLLGLVAEDLARWLDEESIAKDFSDEEIMEDVRKYLFELTSFDECNEETLEEFVTAYHEPGDWREGGLNCDGDFETCDFCQNMLQEAVAKVK